jgi:CDP-paratose 2-epimerase
MKVIITGGAGFIGSNAASRALRRGDEVIVLDDLSRPGVEHNVAWLERQGAFTLARVDLRDAEQVGRTFAAHRDAGLVLHLAGQTAVTTSVTDPRRDFEINALGTLNVLEALRRTAAAAPLIYASTNKVYGGLEDVAVVERDGRYAFAEQPFGIAETHPLDFHSPYGCSKGAADQYVRDYHRIYGLRTVVLRQSCIFGDRQLGLEDQGWVAWFTIAATFGRPITIYGDGKQVRDVLFIDDLLDAFDAAARAIDTAAGRVYNIGGGPDNVLAVAEVLTYLERRLGRAIPHARAATRPGDQKVFVSDIRRAAAELGWTPRIGCEQGLERLVGWVSAHEPLFR